MFAISPTDVNWFEYLRDTGFNSDINFWTPTPWNIARLNQGDKLFFMLKSPIRQIGGFGEYKEYVNMSLNDAWIRFGKKNGCLTKQDFVDRLDKYKSKNSKENISVLNSEIGCIVLDNVEFWDTDSYLDLKNYKIDFSPNIVKIKYYSEKIPFDIKFYKTIDSDSGFDLVEESTEKYKRTRKVVERKGQSVFRLRVMKAYGGACCVSGEKTPELIEAAHIQSYLNNKSNHIQNGLLLRVDFHKLFDNGLMYINADYEIEISQLVKSDFYRKFHGKRINLPNSKVNYPSKKALISRKFEFRNK